ncbi:4-aminobutyrate aminotransferase [Vibrio cholerae]|nr:4-aminobutyrate aminotransferase [Vibrio cholerae]
MKTFDPLSSYSPTHWRSEGTLPRSIGQCSGLLFV